MTDDEARTIATRAIDTWPAGPKAYIWQNELKPLDRDHATEAMRKLRQEGADIRNITAQFHAAYRSARAINSIPVVPATCGLCNGTGWIEASRIEAHNPRVCTAAAGEMGCACHAVKPCRCTNAHQAHRIVELIHGNTWNQGAA